MSLFGLKLDKKCKRSDHTPLHTKMINFFESNRGKISLDYKSIIGGILHFLPNFSLEFLCGSSGVQDFIQFLFTYNDESTQQTTKSFANIFDV